MSRRHKRNHLALVREIEKPTTIEITARRVGWRKYLVASHFLPLPVSMGEAKLRRLARAIATVQEVIPELHLTDKE